MWKWLLTAGLLYLIAHHGDHGGGDPTATAPVTGPSEAEIDNLYQLSFAKDRTAVASAQGLDATTLAAAAQAANAVNVPIGWVYSLAQAGVPTVQLMFGAHILDNCVHTQPLPADTQPATLAFYRASTLAKAQKIMEAAIAQANASGAVIEVAHG